MKINQLTEVATSDPTEAAKNINNAKVMVMNPSDYKTYSQKLDGEVENRLTPNNASRELANYMGKSTEHTSIAKQDIGILTYMENQLKLIGDHIVDRPNLDRKVLDLNDKMMDDPENFTENDQIKLNLLNRDRDELFSQNYGIDGPIESLPAQVAGLLSEISRGVVDNAAVVAGFTVGGAVIKGTLASFLPGVGTVLGAAVGGAEGLGLGITTAAYLDGYRIMRAGTFNELSRAKDINGEALNIDRDTKLNISRGVGVVAGIATGIVGRTIAKGTPWLKKFVSPRFAKTIVLNPSHAAIKATFLKIGEAVTAGGGAGSVTEMARIVGEEMGQTFDGSEASFLDALATIGDKLTEEKSRGEIIGRVTKAAAVGAGAAGTIAGGLGAAGFRTTKQRFATEQEQAVASARPVTKEVQPQLQAFEPSVKSDLGPTPPAVNKSVKVLQFQDALINVSEASKTTKMLKASPSQMNKIKQMFFSASGISHLYILAEDARKFATDEEKARLVRNIIDKSGVAASQMNAPIAIKPHEFAAIVREFPKLSDIVRLTPDGPSPDEARTFLKGIEEARGKGQELINKLGAQQLTKQQQKALRKDLNIALEPVKKANDVFNEEAYLEQPTFTEAIKGIISKKEVDKFNEAQQVARKQVVDSINEASQLEMLQVQDQLVEIGKATQIETESARIANDVFVEVVDRFTIPEKYKFFRTDRRTDADDNALVSELTAPHHKPGFSPFAIDPRNLAPKLKKFLKDPQLKKHKVFVRGGVSAEESARLLGVNSGENLLKLLSATPTRKDIIARQAALRNEEIQNLAIEAVDLNQTAISKAYKNNTLNHIREMKFLKDKKWPTLKRGFKRIALPLPTIQGLRIRAQDIISQTRIGNLNANTFKVGERKSQRMAIDSILKNEVEKAFKNKESAALNSELARETHIAIGTVNKVLKLAKRFNKPQVIQELKDAGKLHSDAANELLTAYNLNRSKAALAERGAYEKFVRKQVELGNGNLSIPDRFSDIRPNINEVTVEALKLVGDRLRAILHLAKFKNKLHKKFKDQELIQTEEAIAKFVNETLSPHPEYKLSRIPMVQKSAPTTLPQKIQTALSSFESLFNNMEHLLVQLDQGKSSGPMLELLFNQLKGDGEFLGISGESGARKDTLALKKRIDENIDIYGRKDFRNLNNTTVHIPEFENSSALDFGNIAKADLLTIMAYGADPGGYIQRENWGVSNDVIDLVLERELEVRDAVFVQNGILNTIESYRDRTEILQKETTGQDVTFIEGRSFTHRGRVYPGGYFPIAHVVDLTDENIRQTESALGRVKAAMFGGTDGNVFARQQAAEMTEQGRLEARTGSKKPLNISFNRITRSFEEIIHDLNFRIPVIDTLKLLRHPSIKRDIIAVLGNEKYSILPNTTIEMANKVQNENENFFHDQNRFITALFTHTQVGFAIGVLGANLTSTAVQFTSLFQTMQIMGPVAGPKHIIKTFQKIGSNINLRKEFFDLAAEMNPSILNAMEGIDDNIAATIHDLLPSKNLFPALAPFARAQKVMIEASMSPLVMADVSIKVVGTLAAYQQYLEGDVPGVPIKKVLDMSEKERNIKARNYAAGLARQTLTQAGKLDKAPFQKFVLTNFFAKFWNDLRNVFNNTMRLGRQTKWKANKSYEQFRDGDYKGASKSAAEAAATMGTLVVFSTLAKLWIDTLRGNETPANKEFNFESEAGRQEAYDFMLRYMLTSTPEIFIESIPIIRDIKFAAENRFIRSDARNVKIPVIKILDDASVSYVALKELLDFDSEKELSEVQLKALLFTASYVTGGLPVNAAFKFKRFIEESSIAQDILHSGDAELLRKTISDYLKNEDVDPSKKFAKELKEIEDDLTPVSIDSAKKAIPEEIFTLIKQIESGGDWSAKNKNSSAAGLYQFLEGTWEDIMEQAPELGLTENGRVSKDTRQQEKAMRWFTEQNSNELAENEIPVNENTLYGAHLFGPKTYSKIHKKPNSTSLKTLLGPKIFDANPNLKKFRTVGGLKKLISDKLRKARKQLQ